MQTSRRSVIAAASLGLASLDAAGAARMAALAGSESVGDAEIDALVRRSEEANAALLRGDVDRYRALTPLSADFTLMSPFGGKPSRSSDITPERWDSMRRFFRNGSLAVEVVQAYRSGDIAVLALIERAHGEVGGLPAQDWSLRVTLVFRREAGAWRLAHRHADPLAEGISVQRAAAIARGELS